MNVWLWLVPVGVALLGILITTVALPTPRKSAEDKRIDARLAELRKRRIRVVLDEAHGWPRYQKIDLTKMDL